MHSRTVYESPTSLNIYIYMCVCVRVHWWRASKRFDKSKSCGRSRTLSFETNHNSSASMHGFRMFLQNESKHLRAEVHRQKERLPLAFLDLHPELTQYTYYIYIHIHCTCIILSCFRCFGMSAYSLAMSGLESGMASMYPSLHETPVICISDTKPPAPREASSC